MERRGPEHHAVGGPYAPSDRDALASAQRLVDRGSLGPHTVFVSALGSDTPLGIVAGVWVPFVSGAKALVPGAEGDPCRWLIAAAEQGAAAAVATGRALDAALDALDDDVCDALDLGALEILFVAGEPLRRATLTRFVKRLAGAGLRRDALVAVYAHGARVVSMAGGAAASRDDSTADGNDARWRHVPSRGRPVAGLDLTVATTGELLVSVPEVGVVATGDAGLLRNGELYVLGRLADRITLPGGTFQAEALEETCERADARVRRYGAVAIGVPLDGASKLAVVVALVAASGAVTTRADYEEIAEAISRAVESEHGVEVARVLVARDDLAPDGGQPSRSDIRDRVVAGTLALAHAWTRESTAGNGPSRAVSSLPLAAVWGGLPEGERAGRVESWIRESLRDVVPSIDTVAPAEILDADSLTLVASAVALQKELGATVSLSRLFTEGLSVRSLTRAVLAGVADRARDASPPVPRTVVELVPRSGRTPLFLFPGLPGTVFYLASLTRALGSDRAVYGMQAPGFDGVEAPLGSVEALAERFTADLMTVQPAGPYLLVGHSFGGQVALEVARRLTARGETVAHLGLVDAGRAQAAGPVADDESVPVAELIAMFGRVTGAVETTFASIEAMPHVERVARLGALLRRVGLNRPDSVRHVVQTYEALLRAMLTYDPAPWGGPLTLYRARDGYPEGAMHPARQVRTHFARPALGWAEIARCPIESVEVDGDHFTMMTDPHVRSLAAALGAALDRADGASVAG